MNPSAEVQQRIDGALALVRAPGAPYILPPCEVKAPVPVIDKPHTRSAPRGKAASRKRRAIASYSNSSDTIHTPSPVEPQRHDNVTTAEAQ